VSKNRITKLTRYSIYWTLFLIRLDAIYIESLLFVLFLFLFLLIVPKRSKRMPSESTMVILLMLLLVLPWRWRCHQEEILSWLASRDQPSLKKV